MKKLLFTAFAVVAFSGVAMASPFEDKESENSVITSCETFSADQLEREDPCNDLSATEAGERYRELVEFCEYMQA